MVKPTDSQRTSSRERESVRADVESSHSSTKRPNNFDENDTPLNTNCGLLASGNDNDMSRRPVAEDQQARGQGEGKERSRPSQGSSSVRERERVPGSELKCKLQSESEGLTNSTRGAVSQVSQVPQSVTSLHNLSTAAAHILQVSSMPQQGQQLRNDRSPNSNRNHNRNQQLHHQQPQQPPRIPQHIQTQLTEQQIQSVLPDLQTGLLAPIAAMALPLLTLAQFNPAVISQLTAAAAAQTIVNANTTISNPPHYSLPLPIASFQQASMSSTSSMPIASMPASQPTNNPSSTATPSVGPGLTNRSPIPLSSDFDEHSLTEYQRCVRQNIELFEANHDDIQGSAQGRNVPILLGQVGIRCRYCGSLPTGRRARGAVYYSHTSDGVYQIAQNMAKVHLCKHCPAIPRDLKEKLSRLREVHKGNRAAGAGKEYWSHVLESQGVYEDNGILRFRPVG